LELLLSECDFNAVFIDWNIPLMSGIELVKKIKLIPRLNGLKLIMITGKNEIDDIAQALDAGVDEFLMKPFDAEMIELKLKLVGLNVPEVNDNK
jgi:two-component system chemotaxis response regulator CheY